jgi:hypothetical protein
LGYQQKLGELPWTRSGMNGVVYFQLRRRLRRRPAGFFSSPGGEGESVKESEPLSSRGILGRGGAASQQFALNRCLVAMAREKKEPAEARAANGSGEFGWLKT